MPGSRLSPLRRSREAAAPDAPSLFSPGHNCWQVTQADDLQLLVDGAAYFRSFMRAALNARHTLWILGWDFHSRTDLLCGDRLPEAPDAPAELGEFLNYVAARRHGLQVNILIWDFPTLFGTEREFPIFHGSALGHWKPHRRIRLHYDATYASLGCHHQKVVVADDEVAFCGGFDLTRGRWDTCQHRGDDPRRVTETKPYPPFHDLMLRVTGGCAHALGQLARQRWQDAGQHMRRRPMVTALTAPQRHLARRDTKVAGDAGRLATGPARVAISRTAPPQQALPGAPAGGEVREVEQLFLDMIRAARRSILIENQYFTAEGVGQALVERVSQPDGPELLVIVRLLSHGWLEERTMERLRTGLIRRLQEAGGERVRVYYPHVEDLAEDCCVDVHSKLMIIDEQWLRVGSANLANRSMGLDTECDLTVEAAGDPRVSRFIARCRAALLGEHLAIPADEVEQVIEKNGLIAAVESLRGDSRTLKPLALPDTGEASPLLAKIGDPEHPVDLASLSQLFSSDEQQQPESRPDRLSRLLLHARGGQVSRGRTTTGTNASNGNSRRLMVGGIAILLVVLALTAAWRYTPLAEVVSPQRVTAWAGDIGTRWWAPLLVLLVYVPGCWVLFPRPLITLFAVLAFGPWLGFSYTLAGLTLAALSTYGIGRLLDRHQVERMANREIRQVMEILRERGLLAMTALRLVPLAPFAVEGVVAGAIHIKLWHFALGSALGMVPGTLAATVFSRELEAALEPGGHVNWWLLGSMAVGLAIATWLVRRWFRMQTQETAV